jgi:hypothetical protein
VPDLVIATVVWFARSVHLVKGRNEAVREIDVAQAVHGDAHARMWKGRLDEIPAARLGDTANEPRGGHGERRRLLLARKDRIAN